LSVDAEKIKFFHRWNLIAARKPAGLLIASSVRSSQ